MQMTVNSRPSVQDSVYSVLRQSIMNLNLTPGSEISETEIAQKFNVSRTPVREAFIRLAKEGLIQVVPQRKTLVSLIDFSRVEQEFFLRESLEVAVLELFLKKCQPSHFTEMEQLIKKQNDDFEGKDYISLLNHDDSFHRTLYDVAGQQLSWEMLSSMNGHYYRVRLLTTWFSGIASDVVRQHKHILAALKAKDLTEARRLLVRHVRKLSVEEKLLRDEFPSFFAADTAKDSFDVDFGGFVLNS
jgi:DNA-binding GntR family transcriptional regulator